LREPGEVEGRTAVLPSKVSTVLGAHEWFTTNEMAVYSPLPTGFICRHITSDPHGERDDRTIAVRTLCHTTGAEVRSGERWKRLHL